MGNVIRKSTKVVPIPEKLQEVIDYLEDNKHVKGKIVKEDGKDDYYVRPTQGGRRTKRRQIKKQRRTHRRR